MVFSPSISLQCTKSFPSMVEEEELRQGCVIHSATPSCWTLGSLFPSVHMAGKGKLQWSVSFIARTLWDTPPAYFLFTAEFAQVENAAEDTSFFPRCHLLIYFMFSLKINNSYRKISCYGSHSLQFSHFTAVSFTWARSTSLFCRVT